MDNDDWRQKIAQWAASMGVTPGQETQPKADGAKVVYRPLTVADPRTNQENHLRAVYKAAGHSQEDAERFTHAAMSTVTDEFLVESFKQAGRDIAAKRAAEAEKAAADLEAKKAAAKIKRDHQDRLDREKAATAVALEEVEHTKKLLRSSQDQIEGLMKAQGH
jgi:hypothetical protein